MSESLTVGAITIFVSDIAASTEFYLRVFDTEPIFQDEASTAIRLANVVINLLIDSEAPELIEPAKVAAPDAGTRKLLTINVANCDETVAELTARGASFLNGPIDRPWGQRTAAFADLDGHVWEIASDIR
jgi:catechol 2,3-dioxygenase-like lactoylglutathione lyase family enzyme